VGEFEAMKIETPFGAAWARIDDEGRLNAFGFGDASRAMGTSEAVVRQVAEYFEGRRLKFELELAPKGTEFQQRVWRELVRIPMGETITYTELALRAGREGAARAAGRANATNPIALIVPCHRVVGVDGSLTGFAYGTEMKGRLLEFEKQVTSQIPASGGARQLRI
jgi:methylated-DNA-[protein]-cysteine S-methyltransferase